MVKAKQGDTVRVHFTIKYSDGTLFESTSDNSPLECKIGDKVLVSGFEKALIGMSPGEKKSIKLDPGQAYGPHRGEMVVELSRDQLPSGVTPESGKRIKLGNKKDGSNEALIIDVSESSVTIDTNHPLAGMDLVFEIELIEIV